MWCAGVGGGWGWGVCAGGESRERKNTAGGACGWVAAAGTGGFYFCMWGRAWVRTCVGARASAPITHEPPCSPSNARFALLCHALPCFALQEAKSIGDEFLQLEKYVNLNYMGGCPEFVFQPVNSKNVRPN